MSDLLDKATNDNADNTAPDTTNEPTSLVEELVGEGKKFGTIEDLAKGKLNSDQHIKQLESEGAEMRQAIAELEEQAGKAKALSDVVEEIRKQSSQTGDNQSPVTEEAITKLVDLKLEERAQQATVASNRQMVESTILTAFEGDEERAAKHINTRMVELGLNKETINAMSNNTPKAFLELMGLGDKTNQSSLPSVNIEGDVDLEKAPQMGGRRNMAYFQNLRKKMGVANFYNDHAIQKQMFDERERQGDAFYK